MEGQGGTTGELHQFFNHRLFGLPTASSGSNSGHFLPAARLRFYFDVSIYLTKYNGSVTRHGAFAGVFRQLG